MPLPNVKPTIENELIAAGFNLADASPNVLEVANDIVEQFKTAIAVWAPTAQVATSFTLNPGPIINTITGPFTNVALSGLQGLIDVALRARFDFTPYVVDGEQIVSAAIKEQIFQDGHNVNLIVPFGVSLTALFATWAGSLTGTIVGLGTGVFADPPVNSTVQATFVPGSPLSSSNVIAPAESAIAAAVKAIAPVVDDSQWRDAYIDAISVGVKEVFDAIPGALLLTPVTPVLVGPVGTPSAVNFTLSIV